MKRQAGASAVASKEAKGPEGGDMATKPRSPSSSWDHSGRLWDRGGTGPPTGAGATEERNCLKQR